MWKFVFVAFATALLLRSAAAKPADESASGLANVTETDATVTPPDEDQTMDIVIPEGHTTHLISQNRKNRYHPTNDNVCFRLRQTPEFGHLHQAKEDLVHKKLLKNGDVFCQKHIDDQRITYAAPDTNEVSSLPVDVFLLLDPFDAGNNTLPERNVTITILRLRNM